MQQVQLQQGLTQTLSPAAVEIIRAKNPLACPTAFATMDESTQALLAPDTRISNQLLIRIEQKIPCLQNYDDTALHEFSVSLFEDGSVRKLSSPDCLSTNYIRLGNIGIGRKEAFAHISKIAPFIEHYLQFMRDQMKADATSMYVSYIHRDLHLHGPIGLDWHTHAERKLVFIARGYEQGIPQTLADSVTTWMARNPTQPDPAVQEVLDVMGRKHELSPTVYAKWEEVLRGSGLLWQPAHDQIAVMYGDTPHNSAPRPPVRLFSPLLTVAFT